MDILISGASTGIGRASAIHLARNEHKVWAGVRTQKSYDDLLKMNVRGVQPIFLDVTSSPSIADAVSLIKKNGGVLHALINNAGIAIGGPVEALTMEAWRRQFDINVFGLIELTRACLPLLRESKGRIVNISSISGRIASPFLAPYAASKFAIEAFSDSLRRELRKHGVKVSVIEPGPINTPIWKKSIADSIERKSELPPEMLEVYGTSMDKFAKAMEQAAQDAAPVAWVVEAIVQALTARTPKTRYPVGQKVNAMTIAAKLLPDTWLDTLLRKRT